MRFNRTQFQQHAHHHTHVHIPKHQAHRSSGTRIIQITQNIKNRCNSHPCLFCITQNERIYKNVLQCVGYVSKCQTTHFDVVVVRGVAVLIINVFVTNAKVSVCVRINTVGTYPTLVVKRTNSTPSFMHRKYFMIYRHQRVTVHLCHFGFVTCACIASVRYSFQRRSHHTFSRSSFPSCLHSEANTFLARVQRTKRSPHLCIHLSFCQHTFCSRPRSTVMCIVWDR